MTPSGPANNPAKPDDSPLPTAQIWVDASPLDHESGCQLLATSSLMLGHGAFTTLLISSDGALALDRHLARLAYDSLQLGLPSGDLQNVKHVVHTIQAGLPTSSECHHRLRLTWTLDHKGDGLLITTLQPAPNYLSEARVHTAATEWSRPLAHHGVKSSAYADHVQVLRQAKAHHFDEAVWLDRSGQILEGATSNVFVDVGGVLVTPPAETGILPGITRQLVLDYAGRWEVPVAEKPLHRDVVESCLGAGLTSSLRGVQEVAQWGTQSIPQSPLINKLRAKYRELVAGLPESI